MSVAVEEVDRARTEQGDDVPEITDDQAARIAAILTSTREPQL